MADLWKADSAFIYQLYNQFNSYNLSYIYQGGFSKELTDSILALAETNLENIGETSSIKRRVFFIMVESLQNITRHQSYATQGDNLDDSCFFIIQKINNDYYITSGNLVESQYVDSLTHKLDKVNSMDPENLKAYYKEILSSGEISEKGGAGLGLIEMARKSGNKLFYAFDKLSDKYSYFYFQSKIQSEMGNNTSTSMDSGVSLLAAKSIHKTIIERNLNLIYEGEFSQENLKNILAMTEANIDNKEMLLIRKKVFNIIVELLQNIKKHADDKVEGGHGKFGVFLIGKNDGDYVISAGNVIAKTKVSNLKTRLERINLLTDTELDALYNDTILNEEVSEKSTGLGLIDLRLKSMNPIAYEFRPVDDSYDFYTIQIKVGCE